jgi:hypothetical protein
MRVTKYKSVDIDQITISKPIKQDKEYVSQILYKDEPFFIQSPVIDVVDTNTVQFKLVKNGQLFTLFEDTYNRLVNLVYVNSKDFFNGKAFTEKRVLDSLKKLVILDTDTATVQNCVILESVNVFDAFKDKSHLEFPLRGSVIFNVKSLRFVGKSIICDIIITHIKMDYSAKKKISECILGTELDQVDILEENLDDLVLESINDSINDTEEIDELDTIIENQDSEDFF